jgi:hypothetical protein
MRAPAFQLRRRIAARAACRAVHQLFGYSVRCSGAVDDQGRFYTLGRGIQRRVATDRISPTDQVRSVSCVSATGVHFASRMFYLACWLVPG